VSENVESTGSEPDPNESPFESPPVEGIPFAKDSEEARAIRRVIERADAKRAASSGSQ
jgi:hypothetical protein